MGSLRHIDVLLAEIVTVRAVGDGPEIKARSTRNLAPLAWPNRIIDLKSATPGCRSIQCIAIRLDDTPKFDRALRALGVTVAC
jgi:hypothetical protein